MGSATPSQSMDGYQVSVQVTEDRERESEYVCACIFLHKREGNLTIHVVIN